MQQLLRDLATARAAGARIDELVAMQPAIFADGCAQGLTSRHSPISLRGLLAVCLGAGIVAAACAWTFLVRLSSVAAAPPGFDEGIFYLLIDLGLLAAVLTVMVGTVRFWYRRRVEIATLTPRLAITLTGATVVGFPLASLYGSTQGYSLSLAVIGVEVLIVLCFLALGALAAQRWNQFGTWRQKRQGIKANPAT